MFTFIVLYTGGSLMAISFAALPLATTIPQLAVTLVPLSVGSAAINSVPVAYVADLCSPEERALALSLVRTAGDVGFLLGASAGGVLAGLSSIEMTMHTSGGFLGVVMCLFAMRYGFNMR